MVHLDIETVNENEVSTEPKFVDQSTENGKDILEKIGDKAKQLKDVVVDESKILATELPDEFRESKVRLNAKPRVFNPVSNAIIYYAIVGLGLYWIARKI